MERIWPFDRLDSLDRRETSKHVYIYLLIILAFMLLSCQSNTEYKTIEQRLNQAQLLIDQSNYPEAEKELNIVLAMDGGNERARVIKASISVHRSGIKLIDYVRLKDILSKELNTQREYISLNNSTFLNLDESSRINLYELTKSINKTFSAIVDIQGRISEITAINSEAANHLFKAIAELNEIQTSNNGIKLYRGFVKIFYLKYLIMNSEIQNTLNDIQINLSSANSINELSKYQDALFKLQSVRDYLNNINFFVRSISSDLEKFVDPRGFKIE